MKVYFHELTSEDIPAINGISKDICKGWISEPFEVLLFEKYLIK